MHRQRHFALLAMTPGGRTAAGFTLIELMVTITIVAILGMIAVPSFKEFARSSRMTSVTNNLLGGLQTARTEAMKRNRNAMLVPIDAADWRKGWTIFVDTDFDGAYSAANGDILIVRTEPTAQSDEVPDYIAITSNPGGTAQNYILYDGSGFSKLLSGAFGAMTLQLSRTDAPSDYSKMRRIKVHMARLRTCIPKSDSDSKCSASASE